MSTCNEVLSLFDSGSIGYYDPAEGSQGETTSQTLTITFNSRVDPQPLANESTAAQYRSWFNFLVYNKLGFEAAVLTFQWFDPPAVKSLIKNKYRPVYRSIPRFYDQLLTKLVEAEAVGKPDYSVILPTHKCLPFKFVPAESKTNSSTTVLRFQIPIPRGTTCIQVAFTFPYPLNEITQRMTELKAFYPITEENIGDETILYRIAHRPHLPILYISARCHPGETPGSYVLDGILDNLSRLLSHFEVWVVPAINSEGIRLGHYRTDRHGNDLNRCYREDSPLITGKLMAKIRNQGSNTGMIQSASKSLYRAFNHISKLPAFRNFSLSAQPADADVTAMDAPSPTKADLSPRLSLAQSVLYPIRYPINSGSVSNSTRNTLSAEDAPSYFASPATSSSPLWPSISSQVSPMLSTFSYIETRPESTSPNAKYKEQIHSIVLSSEPPMEYCKKQSIIFCLDIHAHASIPNCFLLGNSQIGSSLSKPSNILNSCMAELRSLLFLMVLDSKSKYFDLSRSDFSLASMKKLDKSNNSFENTMRVGIYNVTKLPNVYCFETHYFRQNKAGKTTYFNVTSFNTMGRDIVSAMETYLALDLTTTLSAFRKLEMNAARLNIDKRFYILLKELKMRLGKAYFSSIYHILYDQTDYQCAGAIRRRSLSCLNT